jgi:hypothetical protein
MRRPQKHGLRWRASFRRCDSISHCQRRSIHPRRFQRLFQGIIWCRVSSHSISKLAIQQHNTSTIDNRSTANCAGDQVSTSISASKHSWTRRGIYYHILRSHIQYEDNSRKEDIRYDTPSTLLLDQIPRQYGHKSLDRLIETRLPKTQWAVIIVEGLSMSKIYLLFVAIILFSNFLGLCYAFSKSTLDEQSVFALLSYATTTCALLFGFVFTPHMMKQSRITRSRNWATPGTQNERKPFKQRTRRTDNLAPYSSRVDNVPLRILHDHWSNRGSYQQCAI